MAEPSCHGRRTIAYIFAVLPPLFWSGNFLLARLMHEKIPPFQMSFWRWTIAFIIILPFGARYLREYSKTLQQEWRFLALLGAVGITAFNCFIYSALHYTTVVNASIINSLMPIVTCLFALILLKESLGSRQIVGVVFAFCGAVAIILRGNPLSLVALKFNPGDFLVLSGLCFWAAYTVLIRWRQTRLPKTCFLMVTIGFGVLFHLPLVILELTIVGGFSVTRPVLASILYFAFFPSIFAYLFWNKAVSELGSTKTGMFMYLLPVFSAIFGTLLLGETFQYFHGVGFMLIFIGLILVTGWSTQKDKA